jgi:Major Facilitator Superfamily
MHDHRTAQLRRNRAFKWLLAGSTLSMLGSRLTTIAYPLLILAWHGSPVVAGLAVCAANAPSVLVYIPAGALVDRWADPRRTLIVAETMRGCAIGVILFAVLFDWRDIPLIIGVAIVEESTEVFAVLAERRYVRALVESAQASAAQVGIEARAHVVVLAGRTLGGLLFGVAQSLPFIADLVSFGISVASLFGTKGWDQRPAGPGQTARPDLRKFWVEVRDGWSGLVTDALALSPSLLSAGMTLISQALIIVFLASAHDHKVSSVVIGSVLAASGVGGLLGAMISRLSLRPWNLSPLKFQPLVWTTMLLVLAKSGSWQVPAMAFVMMVLGLAGAMGNVELDTYLMMKVPDAKLARVTSIEMLLDFLASALGPAFGGILTVWCGVQDAMWVLFGVSAAIFVWGFKVMGLKIPATGVPDQIPEGHEFAGKPSTPTSVGYVSRSESHDGRVERHPVSVGLRPST